MLTLIDFSLTFEEFINKLVPSWQALVIQLVATILMILLIGKFLVKPVKKIFKTRQDYVTSTIEDAVKMNKEAEVNKLKAEESLKEINASRNELIENARLEASSLKDKMLKETEDNIKEQLSNSRRQIELEKENAREEVRREIINVALDASSSIIGREVNSEDNRRYVNEFVEDMNKDE